MRKRIIKDYPYPIDQVVNKVIDYIVVYFNEVGEIIDYNEIFKAAYKINSDELETLKIKDLITFQNENLFSINFDNEVKTKRFLIELNKKYIKNPINNSYDVYLYKTNELYCLVGEKDFDDSYEIMNDMALLSNQLSNLSRDLNKKNIELTKANKKINDLLRHDKLTGLGNRRYFMEYIEKEMAKAHRYKTPLSLVMCDLDHFKEINDNYGHDVGDLVLQAVGNVLSNETRKGELAARIGGDEFAIVLTQTSVEEGENFIQRIHRSISKISLDEITKPIVLSQGIAELKEDEPFESFFKRADIAMYKAKECVKNKTPSID